jgi:hypothetical protein
MSKLFELIGSSDAGPTIYICCTVILHIKKRFLNLGIIRALVIL